MNNPGDLPCAIFWFRRDLRLEDNHGLYRALTSGLPVLPVFIFDTEITGKLEDPDDARLTLIHKRLGYLNKLLVKYGSGLRVEIGKPVEVFRRLTSEYQVKAVYTNHDYEPYAISRDHEVGLMLSQKRIEFHSFKDQVIFEKEEIVKADGRPYTVFTPYSKAWKARLSLIESYPSEHHLNSLLHTGNLPIPSLQALGFRESKLEVPPMNINEDLIRNYDKTRDYPALEGTTRLGVHLRFGTISIRQLVNKAIQLNAVFLNELIWREFYMMILWNFPYVVERAFKPEYDRIEWLNREEDFEAWKNGLTGYPMVDAGMRQLMKTGYMHNRLRMITASFLTKHLLVDWRWGEAWFARKLLDFELASNNGGWQWAAGTGVDAAPYFRIFNPQLQAARFDPEEKFIKRWLPEYGTSAYAKPVVDHAMARERVLRVYKKALG